MKTILLSLVLLVGSGCSFLITPDDCLDENGQNIGTDTCVGCIDDCLEPDNVLDTYVDRKEA